MTINKLDDFYLSKLLKHVEKKSCLMPSNEWKHSDYEKLSDLIFEKTKIQVSYTTLKRLYGNITYEGAPSISTLNALCQFCDYKDWYNYRNKNKSNIFLISFFKNSLLKKVFFALLILSTFTIIFYYFYNKIFINKLPKAIINKNYVFKIKNAEGITPHTAIMEYDFNNITLNDNIYFSAYNDKSISVLNLKNKLFNLQYFRPGVYKVFLHYKNIAFDSLQVKVFTNEWMGVIKNPNQNTDIYYNEKQIIKENTLNIPDENVYKKQAVFNFVNYKNFNINSNNFCLSLKVISGNILPNSNCKELSIGIGGEAKKNNFLEINFVSPGCLSHAWQYFGNKIIDPEVNDVTMFGRVFSDWTTIKVNVKNNNIKIYIENQEIFSSEVPLLFGPIYFIRLKTNNGSRFDNVLLSDDKVIYQDTFDN